MGFVTKKSEKLHLLSHTDRRRCRWKVFVRIFFLANKLKSICVDIQKYLFGNLKYLYGYFFLANKQQASEGWHVTMAMIGAENFYSGKLFFFFYFSHDDLPRQFFLWNNCGEICGYKISESRNVAVQALHSRVQYWRGRLLENRLSNEVQPYNSYDWTPSLKYLTIKLKEDQTVFIMITLFPRNVQNP